jgi:hypothetical protein
VVLEAVGEVKTIAKDIKKGGLKALAGMFGGGGR